MTQKSRSYFAYLHLISAVHLTKAAREIKLHDEKFAEIEAKAVPHRAHVTGAIFLAVGFLEAFINELYSDAHDGELPATVSENVNLKPSRDRDDSSESRILVKYQHALAQNGVEMFDRESEPYLSVSAVITLRNKLIHFTPKWLEHGDQSQLDEKLRGRFELDPYWAEQPGPLFPHRCLTHDCAKWAIESCVKFVGDFLDKMGQRLDSWWPADRARINKALDSLSQPSP